MRCNDVVFVFADCFKVVNSQSTCNTNFLYFLFFQSAFAGGHGQANAFGFALVVPAEEVERVETSLNVSTRTL